MRLPLLFCYYDYARINVHATYSDLIKYSKNYDLSTFINLVKGINETLG